MSPQQPENGNDDATEKNSTPNINEMAKRWRQGAPDKPSESPEEASATDQPDDYEDTDRRVIHTDEDDLIVSYHGTGHIYLPRTLQRRLGADDWETRTKIPADYDEETHDLTIHFGDLVADNDIATDGGGLSEAALAELIADLRGDAQ